MSELPPAADVVVVGGGVIGTSAAFHLAEAGLGVCLLERDQLAGGSTSRAAGGFRAQFSDPLNIAIGLRSIEAFTHFGERPGAEIDLHQVGYLFLLDHEEDVASFRASVALQNELGVPSRFVELDEVGDGIRMRGAPCLGDCPAGQVAAGDPRRKAQVVLDPGTGAGLASRRILFHDEGAQTF